MKFGKSSTIEIPDNRKPIPNRKSLKPCPRSTFSSSIPNAAIPKEINMLHTTNNPLLKKKRGNMIPVIMKTKPNDIPSINLSCSKFNSPYFSI